MRRGRGGGVGGTRYHKSFRAKGSQLSYALKASRVSIGALSLSFSIERRIHTECRWRARRYQGRNIDNYYQRPSSRLNIFLEFKFSIQRILSFLTRSRLFSKRYGIFANCQFFMTIIIILEI